MTSADRYVEVLTNANVATLKPLIDNEMRANTHRALASALAYLEAWCRAATGRLLAWLADPELVLKFIAHRCLDRTILKVREPHAPKTLSWRVSN